MPSDGDLRYNGTPLGVRWARASNASIPLRAPEPCYGRQCPAVAVHAHCGQHGRTEHGPPTHQSPSAPLKPAMGEDALRWRSALAAGDRGALNMGSFTLIPLEAPDPCCGRWRSALAAGDMGACSGTLIPLRAPEPCHGRGSPAVAVHAGGGRQGRAEHGLHLILGPDHDVAQAAAD